MQQPGKGGLGVATLAEHKGIYGFLYGAGDEKIGKIVGKGSGVGKKLREKFLRKIPALDKLIKRVKKASRRGYILGADGRKLWVRRDEDGNVKEHTALNVLLQAAGSIVFKVWLLYVYKLIIKRYDDVKLLISYHDEVQLQVPEHLAKEVKEKVEHCARKAGTYLDFRCPIDAEGDIGNNWSETH